MAGIDETREFRPVQLAILTISDTRTEESDTSGRTLKDRAEAAGHRVLHKLIVTDDVEAIVEKLRELIADPEVDAVIATGGTGLTGRDVTPEAFAAVVDKEIPGFGELFRWLSFQTGSTGACRDAWAQILQFQLDSRYRPCNFVELMPRLRER
jgi:molybdenum cofactor biosynthesis protein B